MNTDDIAFNRTILDEALHIKNMSIRHAGRTALDEKTALWVIRKEAWEELERMADYSVEARDAVYGKGKSLMGIPVRITIGDEEETPMVQLVMEPELHAPSGMRF